MNLAAAWWFTASLTLCVIGGYVAIFTVTLHKGRNVVVCMCFMGGAFLDLALALFTTLHPR